MRIDTKPSPTDPLLRRGPFQRARSLSHRLAAPSSRAPKPSPAARERAPLSEPGGPCAPPTVFLYLRTPHGSAMLILSRLE